MGSLLTEPVKFVSTVHDFGTVSKQIDLLSYDFVFENTSDAPLSVSYAVASCSCTEVRWPLEPVPASGSAVISVVYHRERYANAFEKFITVNFGEGIKPVKLTISGTFVDDKESLRKDFPCSRGAVRFQSDPVDFGTVHPGVPVYKTLTFANSKDDDSVDLSFDTSLSGIEFSEASHGISALSRWDVSCSFVPDSLEWGRRSFFVTPIVDGERLDDIEFRALVLEDFSSLTSEQRNKSAIFRVLGEVHHFGIVRQGDAATARIGLENVSDVPLRLKSVRADRDGIVFDYPEFIPARSKAGIEIRLSPAALQPGDNRIIISLVSDSPLVPYTEVELLGCVK